MCLIAAIAAAALALIWAAGATAITLAIIRSARRLEEGDPDGCSPWGCRSGGRVA